jgi:hypothetical protein
MNQKTSQHAATAVACVAIDGLLGTITGRTPNLVLLDANKVATECNDDRDEVAVRFQSDRSR